MARTIAKNSATHPKITRLATVALAILVVFSAGLNAIALVAGSLPALVRLLPPLILGVIALFLLLRRKATYIALATAALFLGFGSWTFYTLFTHLEPVISTRKVVSNGNPWVIEGSVLAASAANDNYNNLDVVKIGNVYRMYFHDDNNQLFEAESADGKQFGNVTKLFSGQMPAVIEYGPGQWRMYYIDRARANTMYSATSTNGLNWVKEAGVRLSPGGKYDKDGLLHPSVVQLQDGSYKLYYDGADSDNSKFSLDDKHWKILSASSKDGLTWTKDPGIRINPWDLYTWEASSPDVHLAADGVGIDMYYHTPYGFHYATSKDGLAFKTSKNPILSNGMKLPLDQSRAGTPGEYQDASVVPFPGGERMYFWIHGKGFYSAFQKS